MLRIVTVLKTGGCYDANYVMRLHSQCRRWMKMPFSFTCLTDDPSSVDGVVNEIVPLVHGWSGRFSMQEVYRITGPVLSFGLDTVFAGDITPYGKLVLGFGPNEFLMHRPFNEARKNAGELADGIMGWNGDWSDITAKYANRHGSFVLEQQHTSKYLQDCGARIHVVDDPEGIGGIYSYKKHIRGKGMPGDVRVICFHGNPKPHELVDKEEFVRELWR